MSKWDKYVQKLQSRRAQSNWKIPEIEAKVYGSVHEVIGNTPLIELTKIPKHAGLVCKMYAKCEFFNPAGSIKDRIAYAMMQDAEAHGVVNEDTTFIEPTSGNTGIGVVFNASIRGNDSIIVLSEKDSDEKVDTMRLLGANVIQIKENMSHLKTAIAQEIKDSDPDNIIMLQQYENDVNPRTHYEHTGVEISKALGPVDMVVMAAGSGGTMSGIAYRLKEDNPQCLVVAADPDGSILFNTNGEKHPFLVEGVTPGEETPIVLDKFVVDTFEVVTDEEAFLMARDLCKKEGLLCGGSSGLITAAAVKAAKRLRLTADHRVVVILPDGIRNYMSKFVRDQWMEAYLFKAPPEHDMEWWNEPITAITDYRREAAKLLPTNTCAEAVDLMHRHKVNVVLITDDHGLFIGAASKDAFRNYATNPTIIPGKETNGFDFENQVGDYTVKHVYKLAKNGKNGMPSLGLLARVLDITPFVVVGHDKPKPDHKKKWKDFVGEYIITGDDFLEHLYQNKYR